MRIIVNGEGFEVADDLVAAGLMADFGYDNQRVALEVNRVIVARSEYADFVLKNDDEVVIIKAVGGG